MTSQSPLISGRGGSGTLAEAMAVGSLPLTTGLRYVTEVARLLHSFHRRDRCHGNVTAGNVRLFGSAVELAPSRGSREDGGRDRDIYAFGVILYQVITGTPVPPDISPELFRPAGPAADPEGIRKAALRLAGECLGCLPAKPSMRQAETELRLLWMQSRQFEASEARKPQPSAALPAPAPFLVKPAVPQPKGVPLDPNAGLAQSLPAGHETPALTQRTASANPESPDIMVTRTPEVEPAGGRCPKCENSRVHKSRPRTDFECRLAKWGIPICLCRKCYHRFVVVLGMKIGKQFHH